MKNNPIRILQIVPNMQSGGLENLIMNIYRNIDRNKVQFDFLVHYKERKFFDDEIEELGGKIFRFPLRDDNNIFKYIKELNRFYKDHPEYKVIHCHMSSIGFINFVIAKHNKINVRIAHSHNSSTDKTLKGRVKRLMMLPYKYLSTINYACSTESGKYLYGNKKFEIIPNAIDTNKFEYNEKYNEEIREKFKINMDDIVIGHIGRFNIQKNHIFLLKSFKEAVRKDNKLKLLLIGDGELMSTVKKYILDNELEKNVIVTGVVSDTWKYYSAFNIFALPSLFEGLPVVGVEAQCSGVKCIFADNITRDIVVSDLIEFKELNEEIWTNEFLSYKKSSNDSRKKYKDVVLKSKFNIKKLASYLEKEYIRRYSNAQNND